MSGPALFDALRSRRTLAVSVLSFASGLPLGLVWYTIPDWMRDVGVDIRLVGLLTLAQAPWSFKVLWSPLMDRYVPPFWGRRRGWMAVTQLAARRTRADAGRCGRAARGAVDRRSAGLRDRDRVGVAGHRHRRLRGGGAAQGRAGRGCRRAPRLLPGGDARVRWRVDHTGRPHRLASRERPAGHRLRADAGADVAVAGAGGAARTASDATGRGVAAARGNAAPATSARDPCLRLAIQTRRSADAVAHTAVSHRHGVRRLPSRIALWRRSRWC